MSRISTRTPDATVMQGRPSGACSVGSDALAQSRGSNPPSPMMVIGLSMFSQPTQAPARARITSVPPGRTRRTASSTAPVPGLPPQSTSTISSPPGRSGG